MKKTLLIIITFLFTSCASGKQVAIHARNLMADLEKHDFCTTLDPNFISYYQDFTLSLLEDDGENTLYSPLSILSSLGQAFTGAAEETLNQFTSLFGTSIHGFNANIKALSDALIGPTFKNANSAWIKDSFPVHQEYLQTILNYYDSHSYHAPFDETTVDDINNWVSNQTDGMIDHLIDDINPATMMFLINALLFDAEWEKPYKDRNQISENTFYNADGSESRVTYMNETAYSYLETSYALGIEKTYTDDLFSFIALQPKGTITDLLNQLAFSDLALATTPGTAFTFLPKFKFTFEIELKEKLMAMGITDAFTDRARFDLISEDPLFINQVIHQTAIEVSEKGTKAAAVTSTGMATSSDPSQIITIRFDRPFLILIMADNVPVFSGIVNLL